MIIINHQSFVRATIGYSFDSVSECVPWVLGES